MVPYRRKSAPSRRRKHSKFQRLAKKVSKIGLPEQKRLTTVIAPAVSIGPLGSIVNFNLIPSGADEGERVGDIITNQSLHGYLTIVKTPANVDLDTFVRVVFFRDLAHNGTAPAVTEILESASYNSPFSLTAKPRYSIISDTMMHFGTSRLGQENMPTARHKKINYKLGQKVYYQGPLSNEASLEKGPVYMLLFCSPVSVPGTEPTFECNLQLRYTDN